MSIESTVATYLEADATLMATLTGGVYTSAEVGREGITRGTASEAFGTDGYLKPCALVKQRGPVPDGMLVEQGDPAASFTQVVEIYLYEDSGYSSIDTALGRLFALLYGHQFSGTFPLEWIGTLDRERDEGALKGSSMARQDWLVASIQS